AVSYRTVEQAARRLDTDVTVISLEPSTLSDIMTNIHTVGDLTNTRAEAERVVADLRVPEQVRLAGGEASFGFAGADSRTTTAAQIRDYAPEVIVLAPCGFTIDDTVRQLPRARLPEGWSELPAVRAGAVWAVDATSYFSRPGPRVVDGAEILARIPHREVCGEP